MTEPVASGLPDATPSRRETTDEDYRAGLLRQINAYLRRIRASGLPALADAVALRDALDLVIDAGVDICRSETWQASWSEIGAATGLSRSAAQERWSGLGGARRPGGQPSNLR